jgi:hypothetical protein
MPHLSDYTLHSALGIGVAAMVVVFGLLLLTRRCERLNPGLALVTPVAVGLAARFATVIGIDGTGLSTRLRGGDELTFMQNSRGLASLPFTDGHWITALTHELHTAVFGFQIKLADLSPAALRMTQIGISLLGLLLLLVAVHEMAGPRAARLAAWVLMLEPAGIFFDSSLHKEPLMLLASGLTVYGATKIWRHLDFRGLAIAAAGCAVALTTRSYAGWFLVCACVALGVHGAIRRMDRPMRALPLLYAVVLVGFLLAPALLAQSSPQKLKRLQVSQDYNAAGSFNPDAPGDVPAPSNGNNLALERVDFSTRSKIITNLPKRIRDVVLRPYPWQVANTSQALGALGSVVALAGLALLLRYAWRMRGRMFLVAAPLIYPTIFLLVAYSVSAGNAGTSFRYRTHVVTLALAMLIVFRTHVLSESRHTAVADPRLGPAAAGAGRPQPVT